MRRWLAMPRLSLSRSRGSLAEYAHKTDAAPKHNSWSPETGTVTEHGPQPAANLSPEPAPANTSAPAASPYQNGNGAPVDQPSYSSANGAGDPYGNGSSQATWNGSGDTTT